MFGDADIEDLDPENLETSKVKDLHQAAAQAETWNRKTAQRIQMAISQNLHQTLGVEATLPEDTAKELVLQVMDL